MHDIDRISLEGPFPQYEGEGEYGQYELNEFSQYEADNEYEAEYENDFEADHENIFEASYESEGDFEYEAGLFSESPFSEAEEMALASELLNVTNEGELDQFIGKLLGKGLKGILRNPLAAQLGGIVKGAARTALPMLGAAAGNFLIPGLGGAMGSKLASAAGSMLGLELEGLSREDQEFELARQIVRFGGAAAQNVEQFENSAPPPEVAKQAAVAAAQRYAPGLLRPNIEQAAQPRPCGCRRRRPREGRWVRRGNKILLIGV